MNKRFSFLFLFIFLFLLILTPSCKKDTSVLFPDNTAPYYDGIPKVKVQNYINRLFIDLIGREPLDAEMTVEENFLRANDFSIASREQLITKLQTNTDWIEGDTSYKHAYYNRFYELCKARVIEAVSNEEMIGEAGIAAYSALQDSLAGDSVSMSLNLEKRDRYLRVVSCEKQYRLGEIEIAEIFARMVNNGIYDKINMNTFNFVNACFDDLYMRFPTSGEFNAGYDMVEYEIPKILLGRSGQNKGDFINIIVNNDEFYEGIVRWLYVTLMAREPSSAEVNKHMQLFFNDHNVQKLQLDIMKTDEYANF